MNTDRICTFPDCGKHVYCKGLCSGHYSQVKKRRPLTPIKDHRPRGTPPRIEYVETPCPVADLEGPCHVFTGCKDKDGYGLVRWKGRNIKVHRHVWDRDVGPIEAGKVIDHRCRVKACCNVKHLRPVTDTTNALENSIGHAAKNSRKTHCKRGHPFGKASEHGKRRDCATCKREAQRVYKARRKAIASEVAAVMASE